MSSFPFQAFVFDLGGVIVQHDNAMLFERLASRCARSWGSEEVTSRLRQGGWGTGAPIRALYDQLKAEGGYDAPWSVFLDDWCCHLALDPSMLALLRRLSMHNRIVIFSNTNQEHWDFIVRASDGELASYEAYLSHLIGHEKPSLRAFQIVAERAGIAPGSSVFFDDMPINVDGARRAGFQAEVFLGEQWLLTYLEQQGVAIG